MTDEVTIAIPPENTEIPPVQQAVIASPSSAPQTNEIKSDNLQAIPPEETNTITTEEKRERHRPCEFCPNRTKIMQKIHLYAEYCEGKVDGHPHTPYLQELCGYDYLDILTTHLWQWVKNEPHREQHLELSNTIKKLLERQQLRLLQRTLMPTNPAGAIFQLKANHGMIETEKQILAGQAGQPVEYNIHIIPKSRKQIEQEQDQDE